MEPFTTSALVMAGSNLLGGAISSAGSAKAVKRQIAWERERAQNAHQWEIEDLKKAGMNPALTLQGAGATTGSIDSTNTMAPLAQGIQNAGQSAMSQYFSFKQLENQTKLNEAQVSNIIADTINKAVEKGLISAKTAHEQAQANLARGQTEMIPLQILETRARTAHEQAMTKATYKTIDKMVHDIALAKKLDKRQEMQLKMEAIMKAYELGLKTPDAIGSILRLIPLGKYLW